MFVVVSVVGCFVCWLCSFVIVMFVYDRFAFCTVVCCIFLCVARCGCIFVGCVICALRLCIVYFRACSMCIFDLLFRAFVLGLLRHVCFVVSGHSFFRFSVCCLVFGAFPSLFVCRFVFALVVYFGFSFARCIHCFVVFQFGLLALFRLLFVSRSLFRACVCVIIVLFSFVRCFVYQCVRYLFSRCLFIMLCSFCFG